MCPDCGYDWPEDYDYCPNCHLTLEDILAAEDYLDWLENAESNPVLERA